MRPRGPAGPCFAKHAVRAGLTVLRRPPAGVAALQCRVQSTTSSVVRTRRRLNGRQGLETGTASGLDEAMGTTNRAVQSMTARARERHAPCEAAIQPSEADAELPHHRRGWNKRLDEEKGGPFRKWRQGVSGEPPPSASGPRSWTTQAARCCGLRRGGWRAETVRRIRTGADNSWSGQFRSGRGPRTSYIRTSPVRCGRAGVAARGNSRGGFRLVGDRRG